MAVTVKDFIGFLDQFEPDLEVYWGIGIKPCWVRLKNANVNDMPIGVEYKSGFEDRYLYFGDYRDVRNLQKEINYYKYRSFLERLKFLIFNHF